VELKETNINNYLSAGEMPLPALYFMMSLLFFLSGSFWVFILSKSRSFLSLFSALVRSKISFHLQTSSLQNSLPDGRVGLPEVALTAFS